MSDEMEFLRWLAVRAAEGCNGLRVIQHGEGFAVGSDTTGWGLLMLPPVKITHRNDRWYFDTHSATTRVKFEPLRDKEGWHMHADFFLSRQNQDHNPCITATIRYRDITPFMQYLDRLCFDSATQANVSAKYLRHAAALGFLNLRDAPSAGKIAASYRETAEIIDRYPPTAVYLRMLCRRAQETLFANLNSKAGYERSADYEDPMNVRDAWQATRILGIPEGSSSNEREAAFRRIAFAFHPDRRGSRYLFQLAERARVRLRSPA